MIAIYDDRFGDFEGFALLTKHGGEHWSKGREPRMEELIRNAWTDRSLISMFVDARGSDWPAAIVLHQE